VILLWKEESYSSFGSSLFRLGTLEAFCEANGRREYCLSGCRLCFEQPFEQSCWGGENGHSFPFSLTSTSEWCNRWHEPGDRSGTKESSKISEDLTCWGREGHINNEYQQHKNCLGCCPKCLCRYRMNKDIRDWENNVVELHLEKQSIFPPSGETLFSRPRYRLKSPNLVLLETIYDLHSGSLRGG